MRSSMPEININRKRERNNPQRSRDLRQLKKKNKINFRFRIGNQAIHEPVKSNRIHQISKFSRRSVDLL